MAISNFYKRAAYSDTDFNSTLLAGSKVTATTDSQNRAVFAGGDLYAYINAIKVGNLESVSYSVSVEIVGQYAMGSRDPLAFTRGKRVIIGSLMFTQFDQHAVLDEVFKLRSYGNVDASQFWDGGSAAKQATTSIKLNPVTSAAQGVGTANANAQVAGYFANSITVAPNLGGGNTTQNLNLQGLNQTDFNLQVSQEIALSAAIAGSQKIQYVDQLPPFDLTLIGVDETGNAAKMSIFGIKMSNESGAWSQNDLGNSVAFSYVARAIDPWTPVNSLNSSNTINAAAPS
jgi:hypothetical protein